MFSTKTRSSIDQNHTRLEESMDLEAMIPTDHKLLAIPGNDGEPKEASTIQILLRYPSQGSLKIRPTSWLDGVRGVAALGVYIFHAMGCWASIVAAWHSDED